MNKNLMLAALLIAVSCQSVSAVSEVPASMMSNAYTAVASFVKNHKIASSVVGVSALLYGLHKWASKKLAQWNAGVEKELDELVVKVKKTVTDAQYVAPDQLNAADKNKNPYNCILKGEYAYLDSFYPKIIELANDYIVKMNCFLKPNITPDERAIAKNNAQMAAIEFHFYVKWHVFEKIYGSSENQYNLMKSGVKILTNNEIDAKFLLPVPDFVRTDRRR